jgi:hypothetical protein
LDEANSIPRPIIIPKAVAGYFADLLIQIAKSKLKK